MKINQKISEIIKNIYYTFSANVVTLIISMILTLSVPRLLGVAEYGYWQLYMFYLSYAGMFHLGILDGMYLKIGGKHYDEINKNMLKSQFLFISLFEIMIGLVIISFSLAFLPHEIKQYILIFAVCSGFLNIIRTFVLYVLQGTNRIKEYAKYTKIDRYIYFILCILYLFFGGRKFEILIYLDIFSRIVVILLSFISIKDILKSKATNFQVTFEEIKEDLSIGSKLMLGNIAGQLILGIIRLAIENKWSIEVFGQLSLTLSISNMILTLVSSVSIVMFPMLRRVDSSKLPSIYVNITNLLNPICFFILLFYPFIAYILLWLLPKYASSIYFMGIIFPIFIYESKVSMLTMTYLKTMRMEKAILLVNLLSLFLSIISTFIAVYIFSSLLFAVSNILTVIMFRSIFGDLYLSKKLNVKLGKNLLWTILLTLSFVLNNIIGNDMLYPVVYIIYLVIMRKNIKEAIINLKKVVIISRKG